MSKKRIYDIPLIIDHIKIPNEILNTLGFYDKKLKLVLSNDCFIVISEDKLKEYLEN